jgi:hypothetical protein
VSVRLAERAGRRRRSAPLAALVGVALVFGNVIAVDAAAAQQPPPPEAPAEEFRHTADEVLSRQEFQRPEPTVLERARDWLGDRLDALVRGLTGGGAGSAVGWTVLVLAVGALVWSVTRLGRTVRTDPSAAARIHIDQGRTPAEWRDRAERLEAQGGWKEALRCRYRALLGDLVRAGVIEDVPGRTTGEYRREVERALPDGGAAFGEATELFEWVWYANQATGPDESARFQAAAGATVAASSTAVPPVDRVTASVG